MDPYKGAFAIDTAIRTLEEAAVGKDVLIGLSAANVVTSAMLKTMAARPIIFALANPDPEIPYDAAVAARPDAIVATGRSDHPNQVNNVLGYPYIFRGALDVRASAINDEMKLAATKAIAELAREDVPEQVVEAYGLKAITFGPDYIIPKPFDERVLLWVAPAVARAAIATGVAQQAIDIDAYRESLERRINPSRQIMRKIFALAKATEARLVFSEGEDDKVLRAAQIVADERICRPILLGRPDAIRARARELTLDLSRAEIIWPSDFPRLDEYVESYWLKRRRKGMTRYDAQRVMSRERRAFGMMMVDAGDADGIVSGIKVSYPETIRPALQIIGLRPGVRRAAGMYMMLKGHEVLFCADTTVNIRPDAETLAEIAITTADAVRVAMLSFSNFGSVRAEDSPRRVAEATAIVKRLRPDMMVDGEMQADLALDPALRGDWSFSDLKGPANVLIFPDLDSGNIAYKLLTSFGGAEAVGPILLGMRAPVTVLSQTSAVETIVHMAAITVATSSRMRKHRAEGSMVPPARISVRP
jgi:malate dehydrogenase (oxaloacetate-decarboxylating)(NADP+)